MMKARSAFCRIVLGCGILLAAAPGLFAQKIEAKLGSDHGMVGQPVPLQISVFGLPGVKLPEKIDVPGLDIRLRQSGISVQAGVINGRMSQVVVNTHVYLVVPLKVGEFTIPSISINTSAGKISSAPQTLLVGTTHGGVPVLPAIPIPQSAQQPAVPAPPAVPRGGSPQDPAPPEGDGIAFGQIVLPRKNAYVGEVIPVELRFFFDINYPARVGDIPRFSGDGFTVTKFSEPDQRRQEIGGRTYHVLSFQTAITPAKSGLLEIPPAVLPAQIRVPSDEATPQGFMGGLFGGIGGGELRDVNVESDKLAIEVKPLPVAGKPAGFSGAVGQFSLTAEAAPKKTDPGEPVTLTATVAGRGNFDAMGAPVLIEADGWRTYPPGEKFTPTPGDKLGFSGRKLFEFMIVAREDRKATPAAEFSFFDPALEKYVTVKSAPINVEARGSGAAVPAVAIQATPTPAAQPTPTPVENVLATRFAPASFTPLTERTVFLAANGAAAAVWLGVLLFGVGRAFSGSTAARRSAERREARQALRRAGERSIETDAFYRHAVEFVSRRLGGGPAEVRERLEAAKLSEATRASVTGILDAADECKFSTTGSRELGAEERRRMSDQLKAFDEELG